MKVIKVTNAKQKENLERQKDRLRKHAEAIGKSIMFENFCTMESCVNPCKFYEVKKKEMKNEKII